MPVSASVLDAALRSLRRAHGPRFVGGDALNRFVALLGEAEAYYAGLPGREARPKVDRPKKAPKG